MAALVVAGNNEVPTVVNTPFIPKEGPRDLPLLFDWSLASSFNLDLQQQIQNNQFSRAQTIYVDNSANTNGAVVIQWSGTGQIIQIPPGYQGYIPVLATQRPLASVSSTGTGKTWIHVLNVPISPAVWPTTQTTPSFTPGGALIVSDAALDSVTTSSGVQVIERVVGSGDIVFNRYKSQEPINGVTNASVANLLVGSTSLFVNFIDIYLSGDASMGAQVVTTDTLNPSDKGAAVTLDGSHLKASAAGAGTVRGGVRANSSFSTGKYYAEFTYTVTSGDDASGMAIATGAAVVSGGQINETGVVGVAPVNGGIYVDSVSSGTTGGAFTTAQVGAIAVDLGAKLFWAKNVSAAGNWNNNGAANPATGVGGIAFTDANPLFPAVFVGGSSNPTGLTITANYGGSAFTGSAPAGFGDFGSTVGGSQGVTCQVTEGGNVIAQGYAYVGASLTGSTAGPSPGVQLIKLDELNYIAESTGSTLGISLTAGGSAAVLATGNIVYNIGAGATATVD